MMRAALIAVVMLHAATAFAQADGFHREDLRIPMAEAGPSGLEALARCVHRARNAIRSH